MPEFPYRQTLYEFHHKFFLQHKLPIVSNWNLGDIVQGENHEEYHLEVRDDYLNPFEMTNRASQMLALPLSDEEKAENIKEGTFIWI